MAIKSQTQRTLLIGFIGSISACGLVGIYCLLVGSFGSFQAKVLLTTGAVATASILGLASAIPWEGRRWQPVGPLGIVCVVFGLVVVLVAIWGEVWVRQQFWREDFYKLVGVSCVAGVAFPHVGLMSLARLRRQYEWVRIGTVLAVAILAAQLTITILVEPEGDAWVRGIGISAIAVACGTIAVPILHRVSAIRVRESVQTVELSLALTCPRCNLAQQLPVGRSKCTQCGLRFSIEIEEETCAKCGYPLYRLTSAVCPECGTPLVTA